MDGTSRRADRGGLVTSQDFRPSIRVQVLKPNQVPASGPGEFGVGFLPPGLSVAEEDADAPAEGGNRNDIYIPVEVEITEFEIVHAHPDGGPDQGGAHRHPASLSVAKEQVQPGAMIGHEEVEISISICVEEFHSPSAREPVHFQSPGRLLPAFLSVEKKDPRSFPFSGNGSQIEESVPVHVPRSHVKSPILILRQVFAGGMEGGTAIKHRSGIRR